MTNVEILLYASFGVDAIFIILGFVLREKLAPTVNTTILSTAWLRNLCVAESHMPNHPVSNLGYWLGGSIPLLAMAGMWMGISPFIGIPLMTTLIPCVVLGHIFAAVVIRHEMEKREKKNKRIKDLLDRQDPRLN